jgi:hypothetical protein
LKEFRFEFEKKSGFKKKFEKEKEKNKTLPPYLSAQPGLPAHLAIPRRPASPSLFFFSFADTDTRAPLVSPSVPPSFSSSPCSPDRCRSRADPAPPSPLPFSPRQAYQLRHLIAQARLGPFPLSLHRAVMVAAINGKRRPGARLPPFALPLRSYLSTHTSSCASLCTRSTPTHAIEPNFPSTATSVPRRRRANVAVGEGPPPPPPFSSLWVHQGLIKLNWLQVPVLGARGCRALSTPERRPSCCRCQASPLLNLFRLRARPLHP